MTCCRLSYHIFTALIYWVELIFHFLPKIFSLFYCFYVTVLNLGRLGLITKCSDSWSIIFFYFIFLWIKTYSQNLTFFHCQNVYSHLYLIKWQSTIASTLLMIINNRYIPLELCFRSTLAKKMSFGCNVYDKKNRFIFLEKDLMEKKKSVF